MPGPGMELIDEEEIQEVKDEAERIHKGGSRENQQDETWATVEVVSPIDGTIVEEVFGIEHHESRRIK